MDKLYKNRKLAEGYPNLGEMDFKEKEAVYIGREQEEERSDEGFSAEMLLRLLGRLVDLSELQNVLVLGCGPRPKTMKDLIKRNYNVVGVEPVPSFVRSAGEYLGSPDRALEGTAEEIPLPDGSQDLVVCESVLEHVDSPTKSLDEIYRVLAPGGVVFIDTTNRYRISPSGQNSEYNVRYFNWLPDTVKESFVFHHLHYDPSLANYTGRPAVHWYSYADLCKLGRQAGFGQFYSILDLVEPGDAPVSKNKLKGMAQRFLANKLKYNPWLRALALTQTKSSVFMLKRR